MRATLPFDTETAPVTTRNDSSFFANPKKIALFSRGRTTMSKDMSVKPIERTPAEKAKRKSKLYLLLGICLLIFSVIGIGDFFPLAFLSGIYFLVLSLVNFFRKRKYGRYGVHPSDIKPENNLASKIRRTKRSYRTFQVLSLLFLLGAIAIPPLVSLAIIFIFIALILLARWRKLSIRQIDEGVQDEARQEKNRLDNLEGKLIRSNAWQALFFLFLILVAEVIAFAGFIALSFEFSTGVLWVFMLAILALFVSLHFFRTKGSIALEYAMKLMARHPGERFYKYRGVSNFGKFMGKLAKRPWLMCLIYVLLLILIGLMLL